MARSLPLALAVLLALAPAAAADDPDPPTFIGITVAPGPYHPGDLVPIEVRWEDASGLAQVWGLAKGPGDLFLPGLTCADPAGDRVAAVACTLQLPERAPEGAYRVTQVTAMDVVGHTAEALVDAPFTVESPFADTEGPRLTRLTQLTSAIDLHDLVPTNGFVAVPGAFEIEATDASALRYAGLQFTGPNGNHALWAQCDSWESGRASCTLYGDAQAPAGDFVLREAHLQDEIGYHSLYLADPWPGGNVRSLAEVGATGMVVHVASPRDDAQAPSLTDLTFPGRLHRGQPFELRLNATDANLVESAQVYFRTTRGNAGYTVWHAADCAGAPAPTRELVCRGRFPANYPLGLALVDWVIVEDDGRNMRWLRPVEAGGCCDNSFADGDRFDVGTVLVPRPVEGVLEAVDAIVNEVMPGEVATLVYHAEDAVDDVQIILEDAVDHSRIVVDCADAVQTLLGKECDFTVPADEDGVLSLVSATVTTASGQKTTTFPAGDVPLLAVQRDIPSADDMVLAMGGGAANTVGHDWAAQFAQAKQAANEASTPDPPTNATSEPTPTVTPGPAPPAEPRRPFEPMPYAGPVDRTYADRTYTATQRAHDVAGPGSDSPPIRFEPGDRDGAEADQDIPLPLAVTLGALATAFALRRRRA